MITIPGWLRCISLTIWPARAYQTGEEQPGRVTTNCPCLPCTTFRVEAATRHADWADQRRVFRAEHPHRTRDDIAEA